MRAIKFRSWVPGVGMCYSNHNDLTRCGPMEFEWSVACIEIQSKSVPDLNSATLMQFTDLFDLNGKEIWEGDILRIENEKSYEYLQVKFGSGCFYGEWGEQESDIRSSEHFEIIGNIYEHHHLLTEEEKS